MKKIVYILFLLTALCMQGQTVIDYKVDDKNPKIGQVVQILFVCESSSYVDQIRLPFFDPEKYEYLGSSTNRNDYMDAKYGIEKSQLVAIVYLRPKVAGPLKIGSAVAVVGDKLPKTEPFEINVKNERYVETRPAVRNNAVNNEVYIRSNVDDEELFANQGTIVVITAYSRNLNSLGNVEDVQMPTSNGVKSYKVGGPENEVNSEGEEYSVRIAAYLVFPEHPGRIELPSATAKIAQGGKIQKVRSNRPVINVKALPAGAPDNYQNAVGNYTTQMVVKTPGDFEINKPVTVQVKVSGVGNMKDLKLPKFANEEDYAVYQPKVNYNLISTKKGFKGEVTADYVIVPKKQGSLPLALDGFSFFDPKDKKYKSTAVATLPILVQTPEQIAASKSAMEKVMENTADVFNQKVKLPVIGQVDGDHTFMAKSSDNIPVWILFVALGFVAFFIYFFYKIYSSNKAASPTGRHYSPHFGQKPVTTIADSEAQIRGAMSLDVNTHLAYLKSMLEKDDYADFFTAYDDMNEELDQHINIQQQQSLKKFVENNFDANFVEEFKLLQNKVEILKFAPFKEKESMQDLYKNIELIYSKIEK